LISLNKIGKYFFNNGDIYEGDFKDGEKNGQGIPSFFYSILSCLIFSLFQASISSKMETNMKEIGSKERETIKVSS